MKINLMGVFGIIALVLCLFGWGYMFESYESDQIIVVKNPVSGELTWHTGTGGVVWQGGGTVTTYQKLVNQEFKSKLMFNDNGEGVMVGQFQVELPLDVENLTKLHTKYGSQASIESSLVAPTINKVIYFSGPLMTSKESSSEKRPDLIRYITDQIDNGVYRTVERKETVTDPITKETKVVKIAEITTDKDGHTLRQEESPLKEYGIKIVNFAPREIDYSESVKEQIKKQQEIAMDVQTSIANALKAEQDKLTAERQGQAKVMVARYEKEVEKERAIVEATQKRDVAQLDMKAEEYKKNAMILRADGEAEYKRRVMQADGALEQKLAAWKEVNAFWADAFAKYNGPALVPSVVMGDNKGGSSASASAIMDMMQVKFGKDLALDMGMKKN